jgi:hypothetical protein
VTVNYDLIEKLAARPGPAGQKYQAMAEEQSTRLINRSTVKNGPPGNPNRAASPEERRAVSAQKQILGIQIGRTNKKESAMNLDLINEIAGVKTAAGKPDAPARYQGEVSSNLINDLIKGASANPRLKNVELGGALSNGGFTQFDIAKTAGTLVALSEAEYTVKEACEALNLDEDTLQAIVVVTQ